MKIYQLQRKKHVQRVIISLILLILIVCTGSASASGIQGQANGINQQDDPPPGRTSQARIDGLDQNTTAPPTGTGVSDLVNQLTQRNLWGVVSNSYEYIYSDWNAEAADDFNVPESDGSWTVKSVDMVGFCRNLDFDIIDCGNLDSATVRFYTSAGSIPGTEIYSAEINTIATGPLMDNNARTFTLDLPTPAVLTRGNYWISVQVNLDFSAGDWLWNERVVQSGQSFAFRNPGGAWGEGCTDWCGGHGYYPDLNFSLSGVKGNTFKYSLPTGEAYAVVEHSSQPWVYASIPDLNIVYLSDRDTGLISKNIPVGANPKGLAISSDSSRVYVALNGGSAVKVIDTTSNTVTNTFTLSYLPIELGYGGLGRLYVSDGSDIESLDPITGALISTLPSHQYAGDLIAISPDGLTLCSSRTGISPASIACYDISTDSPPAPWTLWNVGGNLQNIDISGDGAYLYTACGAPYQITAYNLTTLTQAGLFTTGAYPESVYDSYQGDRVYISGGGTSWAWDAQTYQQVQILDHREVRFLGAGNDNFTAYATDTENDTLLIYRYTSFEDLSWVHWAKNWIEALYNAGLTSGYPDGTYRPENQVTRAEMAIFLLKGMGVSVPAMDGSHPFTDVAGHWAEAWIEELSDQGITGGYPDGTYRPENLVTRAEMAIFLLKGMSISPPDIDGSHPFTDINLHWAEIFIEELYDQGITGGYPDGTYRPENRVTRAEMAVFLVNTFNIPLP